MAVDYFAAPLRCAHCGAALGSGAPTRIRLHPRGDELRPGAALDGLPDDLAHAGYARAAEPLPGQPLRLLETWECDACGHANYAVVEIDGGVMRAMRPVALDHAALDGVHYVSRQLGTAVPAPGTVDDDVLRRLGDLLA